MPITPSTPAARWIAASRSLRSSGVPNREVPGAKNAGLPSARRPVPSSTPTAAATSPRSAQGSAHTVTIRSSPAYRGSGVYTSYPAIRRRPRSSISCRCSWTGMASGPAGWAVVKTVSQLPVQRIAVPASSTQSSSPAAAS